MSAKLDETLRIAGYQIIEQLYSGSRTQVYRAIRECDRLPVVIKLLKREYPTFSELVQFRNQYAIAKNLNISGIIKPYSLETYHNGYALVMEDFGGISLRQFTQGKTLTLEQFLPIALEVLDTLHQLHQQRVIHKDIKPANILIHPDTKQIKLIDFSIASLLPRETQEIQSPNGLEGTLAYLSPEQTGRMNRGIDYRSDFYSLGVTFFELLSGQLPFKSHEPMELVHCHIAKLPPLVCDFNPGLPLMLGEIVCKLMAKNAEDRYQSALGLKHDLVTCLEQWQETGKHTWFELGQRDISDRFLIPEKLYGRESEVQTLLETFGHVANGGSQLMLVAGFSGIGKTAIVNEVHKPIVRWNGYFIKGKYDQFNRNIPLSGFVQAFRDLMGQLLSESDTRLEHWQSKILAAVGENGQVLIEVIPELEQMIGKQPAFAELSGSAAQNRFNLLFQKFTQVFASVEHPLVIFLDDLQWADSASLKLMQLLMADTGHLLLIGAYRENEVNLGHPLMLTLSEIQKTQATINTITLAPLNQNTVNQLVADTLKCTDKLTFPLSVLIYQKTQGNPFFTTQFLKALHQDHLIQFNFELGFWQCDIAQVSQQAVTDDVVAFMAFQLQRLPQSTQQVLQLAACIGNQFDLPTLAIVSQTSEIETAADLWKALQEGMILPISDIYKFYQGDDNDKLTLENENTSQQLAKYRFLHDRVQQAAYSLITDDQKTATHLQIGQLLLENLSLIEQEEKLFDIVLHLNQAQELIIQPKQREALAQLNLKAGVKARNSTAYAAARVYLQTGIELLQTNCWQDQYELTLNLYVAAAEAAYLNADFEGMEQMAVRVLQNTQTILDKIKIYEIQIAAQTAQSKTLEAIAVARDALLQLGVELPTEPDEAKICKALQTLATQLQGRKIEELVDLPVMTDPHIQAAMPLLGMLFAPILQGIPALVPLLSSTMVSLSLQFGNARASTVGYAIHGLVLSAFLGEAKTGYSFGKLALNLLDRFNAQEFKCITHNMFGAFIQHHQNGMRAGIPMLKEGFTAGMETGDFLNAGYNIATCSYINFFGGVELDTWEPELVGYNATLAQVKQYSAQTYLQMEQQMLQNLREVVNQPDCLIGTAYDETVMIPKHYQDREFSAIALVYVYKLLLAYSFGNYPAALDYITPAKQTVMAVSGLIIVPIFHFYAALTYLVLFPTQPKPEQAEMLALVETHQTILHQWAQNAPMNYLHKWYLVEAERYRVLGEKIAAIECYDKAITLAKDNEFINEQSLSNELAAKFYLGWGKQRIAQDYLIEAYYGYARWGAKAKVADLEKHYPQLLAPILQQTRSSLSTNETIFTLGSVISTSSGTSSTSSVSGTLDLATILQASQSLSGEIELEKLLSVLLHIVIENAGADKCVFMLLESDRLLIQASAQVSLGVASLQNKGIAHVDFYPMLLNPQPVEHSVDVPVSLINTVKRGLQPAVIIDATAHPQLINDPYIQQQQPKSILCSPILYQGKLLGILYLENNLATGAFTSDRVELLNLLCAQAAISLENARLYQNSQNYAQQLTQSLAKLQASEIRFQNLANNIPGMVYQFRLAVDGSTSTPYVSSGCFDLYGLAPELVMAGTHSLYDMNHPDDIPAITQAIAYSAQNMTPFKQEWRIILPSRTVKWIQSAARPERQADGSIIWDGVVIDISNSKQSDLALQQKSLDLQQALTDLQNAQLQIVQSEKMSALGNLVAGVAHEMNNPLGFIAASLKQAKFTVADIFEHLRLYQDLPSKSGKIIDHAEEIDLDYSLEDLPKMIDSMYMACDRLKNISTSLRTFSRADRDYKVPFHIHQGIDSTILILKHRLKANEQRPAIEVVTNYGNLPQVECFPGQLNQVFMNILANAIDALEESNNGRTFDEIQLNCNRITITTSLENNWIKIIIADNGKGMSESVKQKIFDHLFTTKAVDQGTGLGLAIARQIIVEKHGGQISVESEVGKGTKFTLALPTAGISYR
ncbi:AAA family ATPase [Nostoc sp. CHAB 5824]|nr:AAA family ATPase [Nostoc sp. CHAB 5824]